MTPTAGTVPRVPAPVDRALGAFRDRAGLLGLSLTTWDSLGVLVGPCQPGTELCRAVCLSSGICRELWQETAGRVLAGSGPIQAACPTGCCALGVPVLHRRRLTGAAVACYPARQVLDGDGVDRLARSAGRPRGELAALARQACRHDAKDAGDFLNVLNWLLVGEQAVAVANNELATLSQNLAMTYEELSLLYRISGSMRVTQQAGRFLEGVCRELVEGMDVSAAAAIVYGGTTTGDDDLVVTSGDVGLNLSQVELLAASRVAPRLAREGGAVLDNNFASSAGPMLGEKISNLIAVPLQIDNRPAGMLIGMDKVGGDFVSVDLKLLSSIGNQTSIFLANNRLYEDLEELLMGVLHALTATIDAKDPYTCGHSQRVALISRHLAESLEFSAERVHQIYLAGLLHDIGKIGVPERVLSKPGRLTEDEYEVMKRHPMVGAKILGGIRQLDDVVVGILTHHERPDGRGYPQGLRGAEIPGEGLILGLADGFDAMTSDRTYRKALDLDRVVDEIRRNTGTQFDERIVEHLLKLDLAKYLQELRQPAQAVLPMRRHRKVTR